MNKLAVLGEDKNMLRGEFEELVNAGIEAVPKKFLDMLDNVAILIKDEPTPQQKVKLGLRHGWSLFGLYEGVPQTRRGANYTAVLPDKITIFQKSIEEAAADAEDMKEIVKNTVWHEIAHHFGMDEHNVRLAEEKQRKRKSP